MGTITSGIVDLSAWNTVTIPQLQAAGVVAVLNKCTYGTTGIDPSYHARQIAAKPAGLLFAPYHFGIGGVNGVDQADHLLAVAQVTSGPIALDWESNGKYGPSMQLSSAEMFAQRINEKTGRWPLLYSSVGWLQALLPKDYVGPLIQCPLWIASYMEVPELPPQWSTWMFHQYTDGQVGGEPLRLPGINATLDLNRFNGTADDLAQVWGT